MQVRITIRMSPDLIDRLGAWIANQPGFVSRQEAMRQLVTSALDQQGPQNGPVGHSQGQDAASAASQL